MGKILLLICFQSCIFAAIALHIHARTQVFLKEEGFGNDGKFPRKIAIAPYEMTILEASIANCGILSSNLHITPETRKHD